MSSRYVEYISRYDRPFGNPVYVTIKLSKQLMDGGYKIKFRSRDVFPLIPTVQFVQKEWISVEKLHSCYELMGDDTHIALWINASLHSIVEMHRNRLCYHGTSFLMVE